jgi:acyl-CoA synthetase (AMP-forming)/AMP-acid ligase II
MGAERAGGYVNTYDYLAEHVRPNDPAIVMAGEVASYGDLLQTAERVALTLQARGVVPGDRVGILAENSAWWVASYLGILKSGAVAMPLPARLNTDQLREFLVLAQCQTVCADYPRLHRAASSLTTETMVIVPPSGRPEQGSWGGQIVPAIEGGYHATAEVDERHDLAALMFTSGSTGHPNAVKVSHRNIIANTASIIEYIGLRQDDRMMVVLPLDYCFGTSLLHTHLRVGGTLVINNAFHYIEDVVDDLDHHACTGLAGVPAIYQNLLARSSLPERSLPHLRHAQQAGGMLPSRYVHDFRRSLPRVRFYVMYGQTEATARLSYLPTERLADKMGSIGRGIPGVSLKVLREDGTPVSVGEVGEIVAEGDNVALGYWQEATGKQSFREGRLYTGDRARIDDDGFIYLVGRSSDFLKVSGHRVSAKEIEDVLAEIADVVEVAVVGVHDHEFGEVARAYIVTRTGEDLPLDDVMYHCRRRLPAYAVPKEVVCVPMLPKNDAHKILKHALASEYPPSASMAGAVHGV